jgi:pyruvate-ferredoxin/flavodoxin oxidoreductase
MRIAVDANRKQLKDLIAKIFELGVCCDDMKAALDYAVANWNSTDAAAIANQEKLGELLAIAAEKCSQQHKEEKREEKALKAKAKASQMK